eukprot:TRINITY_DN1575_c2_g2_i2.p1 TRINITY_DN1575_c2_g2~~TRINITY_DN1575_c2_g2_i2.p1  ORF type:complete len:267 (+),score=102.79 TRINITY_DN1575_c2_g2_i2:104-904(+)
MKINLCSVNFQTQTFEIDPLQTIESITDLVEKSEKIESGKTIEIIRFGSLVPKTTIISSLNLQQNDSLFFVVLNKNFNNARLPVCALPIENPPLNFEVLKEIENLNFSEVVDTNEIDKEQDPQIAYLISMGFDPVLSAFAYRKYRNEERAISWLLDAGPKEFEDARKLVVTTDNLEIESNRSKFHFAVKEAEKFNVCTYSFCGTTFIPQIYYTCITCKMPRESGCCIICAKICHKNHILGPASYSPAFFCDCGAKGCRACHIILTQ